MSIPTITFDCDGVFANFTKKFVELLHSDDPSVAITSDWPAVNPVGEIMTQAQWKRGWELVEMTPYFWATLDAYAATPFAKIEKLMAECAIVGYFVSYRPDTSNLGGDARMCTRLWLENHGIKSAQGVIVGTTFNRSELLKSLGCDAHLDDQHNQYEALRRNGINCYLLTRPWNEQQAVPQEHRVNSVEEFLDKVVASLLPDTARDIFFSPAQATDLCNFAKANVDPASIIPAGYRFADLVERPRRLA